MVHGEAVDNQVGGSSAPLELSAADVLKITQRLNRSSGNEADDEASSSSSGENYRSSDYSEGASPSPKRRKEGIWEKVFGKRCTLPYQDMLRELDVIAPSLELTQ